MINQQELFNHMADQHGLTLLQGEMDAIIHIVIHGLSTDDTVLMPRKLTYENGAKGLFMGEFFEYIEVAADEDYQEESGEETCTAQVPVSWKNIKKIYDMAVDRLAVKAEEKHKVANN